MPVFSNHSPIRSLVLLGLLPLLMHSNALHAQDAAVSYGGLVGRSQGQEPQSDRLKSLGDIELSLERVLELLPKTLPNMDSKAERQLLVSFFDRVQAKYRGEKLADETMVPLSNEQSLHQQRSERKSSLQARERVLALKQSNIERRIELMQLKIKHEEMLQKRKQAMK